MFRQPKAKNPYKRQERSRFKFEDSRPCTYSSEIEIEENDTPIKLLRSPNIKQSRQDIQAQNGMVVADREIESLKLENQRLKRRIDEVNGLLITQREMNLQLLKQNNKLMEDMDILKSQTRNADRRLTEFRMGQTVSFTNRQTPRVSTQVKYPGSEEVRKRLKRLVDLNPEVIPFHIPLMSRDISTERSEHNYRSKDKKRSQSIGLLSKSKHSSESKGKLENRGVSKQTTGISLTQRSKSKLVVQRIYR